MRLVIDTTEIEPEAYKAIKEACEAYSIQSVKQLRNKCNNRTF